ncbi:6-deoxyerythronolide-B synthase [Richelia sinica FACHB-800]|uniref:6-deoxyerythronolide-B synthase n=1 Tax=Richelia sinica FACHB-800 TaxID=1357546 RepID=A0A975T3K1_9NOST|nr:type I polyketide synthase [Richelia sinica]MBD2665827.1 SDR family NAD(P)-dependent oxidoreductase [Richelia sinica FACHB-800]QXE21591.1 6-deoxyerythronolide-B synthase [Richelia sinica FACHB-800]
MGSEIAIVGMACRYADATSPTELWENVLAGRRAFRRMPAERLNLDDYFSLDQNIPDSTYASLAALITDYEFDRVGFRVAGSTFRSADLVHWLALDIASQALQDAGFIQGQGLPKMKTGVIVGNTLTGEFSRANTMRLRWPYVRRVVEAALTHTDWTSKQRQAFLQNLEAEYKAPFPEIGAETLAGNLSNTIAGRICNHFDLQGGGFTVDGACSSSLLAVAQASTVLVTGDLDVVIAGGVDLSLDPFEIIGFAQAGALAPEEMRVYDARSAGFIPGEGCGFVVLMRYADALAQQRRIYGLIQGWGISSDGHGGMTRPEVAGQVLALAHAYERANFGIDTVTYFEGHGTGTEVGDQTELIALSTSRQQVGGDVHPAVIGSIKANIGHTKAAAGVAGLIKATMAIYTQVLPPTTGCEQPHPELRTEKPALRVLNQGEMWPEDLPLKAGVSAMGFGGINTHVVIEGCPEKRRHILKSQERVLLSSAQDTELILLAAQSQEELAQQVAQLLTFAAKLSQAEVGDLAVEMANRLEPQGFVRAAIAIHNPLQLSQGLQTLQSWLQAGIDQRLDITTGVFLVTGNNCPRIGFLFPGQGSPVYLNGGAWQRRFPDIQDLYPQTDLPTDTKTTAVAQPAIVRASLSGLRILEKLGIQGNVAVGHSLGELVALHWGGAYDVATLLQLAQVRGLAMSQLNSPAGSMASIRASAQQVQALIKGDRVNIAAFNSPQQTVISGDSAAVAQVVAEATEKGWKTVNLPVSHAFHSPLVAQAGEQLAANLATVELRYLQNYVVSTVTGKPLALDINWRSLLITQITAPVKFIDAIQTAAENLDLLIEVGPGHVLTGLAAECVQVPVVSLDAGGGSLSGLLTAVGAAFVLGTPINYLPLFSDRFTRPFNLNWQPKFFANPCSLSPTLPPSSAPSHPSHLPVVPTSTSQSPLELIRHLVAEKAELPLTAIQDHSRLLSDLHLNSITVGHLLAEATKKLHLSPPAAPTHYADATVSEIAQALTTLAEIGTQEAVTPEQRSPQGVDSWIRTFTVELQPRPLPRRLLNHKSSGAWQVLAPADYPLTNAFTAALENAPGCGVVVCIPPQMATNHINLLLTGAKTALNQPANTHFVLVQHGGGGSGFARTLYLERPSLNVCVVDVPLHHPQNIDWVIAEALSTVGYGEAHYDLLGNRYEPRLSLLSDHVSSSNQVLNHTDVLLVTGGGKGIAAECAIALAKTTGVKLILLGRSYPTIDPELAANLQRITATGVKFQYISVDVSDSTAVHNAVQQGEKEFGAITAILHGAGVNIPKLITNLEISDFERTLAPKVQGLRNLLAAINPQQLRLLITFGSIIARTGLPGEADYALANEWLGRLVADHHQAYPHCQCLNLEWSIWSGVGMGERLGRVDTLMQEGITPISPDIGIAVCQQLLTHYLPTTSVVISGRFAQTPTLKLDQPQLPLWRFLEAQRVYYPGVELIVDVEISANTDPYLQDHVFTGEQIFPGVMGLEAMAEVAMAVTGSSTPPTFTDVKFQRPIVIGDLPQKLRIAALVREGGVVTVVVRSEETNFCVDYFQATCQFTSLSTELNHRITIPDILLSLQPQQDLYGEILFHSGRFQRIQTYRHLKATECVAEITLNADTPWFSSYLPAELVLGDPGARDAAIHALQACIPHATILPVGVDRLEIFTTPTSQVVYVFAQEQSHIDNTLIYNLEIRDDRGEILEKWSGLKLQIVNQKIPTKPWVEPLLAVYIERRLKEFVPTANVSVAIERDVDTERQTRSDYAISKALGANISIWRRPDGKPETAGLAISTAHSHDLTFAVVGTVPLSCDLETVVPRSIATWYKLLNWDHSQLVETIAQVYSEPPNTAATRVWTALECLQKAGAMVNTPLSLSSTTDDAWVSFAAGSLLISTFITSLQGQDNPLIFAVLLSQSSPGDLVSTSSHPLINNSKNISVSNANL